MKEVTDVSTSVEAAEANKKEHPTVALKMLGAKSKSLHRLGLIGDDELTVLLAIHEKAVIKYMSE